MLAIGRILRTGARLLLLDEPTEGLAPVIVQQIGRTIGEAQGARLHDPAGRAEFPLRGDGRGPALRDGSRPRRRHDSERGPAGEHGQAARLPRRLDDALEPRTRAPRQGALMHPNEGDSMNAFKRTLVGLAVAAALGAGAAQAQISDNVIKIGVLNDSPSLYADLAGAGLGGRGADGRRGLRRRGEGHEGRDSCRPTTRTSPTSARTSRASGTTSTRSTSSSTCRTSGVALAVNQITSEKGKAFLVSPAPHPRTSPGKACSPNTIHWTYDTWMLANGTGSAIVKTGGDIWFFLTADYAFGHALERDTEAVVLKSGGKVLGKVRAPAQHAGLLVVPAAGAGVEGQDHRPRQRRRRHDQLRSSRRPSSASSRAGRTSPACSSSSPTSTRSACRPRRAWSLTEYVLLGPERPDARLRQALRASATRASTRRWCTPASTRRCCTT